MDFNFMFTRQDQTVEDCLAVYDQIRHLGIRHLGFKDVGADVATLKELNRRIQSDGATSYIEVVSTTPEACLRSARAAREIGVNRLLGGINAPEVLAVLEGSGIEYLPFPGKPSGHPTKLGGSPDDIARDCARFEAMGCAGVDLLAYRATEAAPLELVKAARRACAGYLLVAGSVETAQQICDLAAAGADGFTIGSAAFAGAFSPRKGALLSQLEDIIAATRACAAPVQRRQHVAAAAHA